MSNIVAASANLLGAFVALVVAAIGYLTGVGFLTVVLRAALAGVVVAFLVKLFGVVIARALAARFMTGSEEPRAEIEEEA